MLHYLWLAKVGVNDPYWYALVLLVLLGIRAGAWARRRLARRRPGVAVRRPAAGPPVVDR